MYATCLHCREPLGRNESIEALPIGRRVAVDAKLGRLWVVCRSCERWNLTPFEERWEAIEQAERAFRDTRVRVSTDNIGLARLREGTEIVRIGTPLRPEFAAWRYGDQFGRRKRKLIMNGVGAAASVSLVIAGATAAGVGLAGIGSVVYLASIATGLSMSGKLFRRFPHPDGGTFVPVGTPRLVESERADGWGVNIDYAQMLDDENDARRLRGWDLSRWQHKTEAIGSTTLHGHDAVPVLRWLLPLLNYAGAGASLVQDGVRAIEDVGGPERFAAWAVTQRREWAARSTFGDTGDWRQMPAPVRLAFEMAIHEDAERRAMDGELATLERAWAEAEGVARIADALLVPADVQRKLDDLRDTRAPE
ncbi:MAG: hypothetical protein ACOVSI_13170 [Gemmatimonas sp.]